MGWGLRSPAFNLCCEQGCLAPMIIEKPPLVSPNHRAPQFPKSPAHKLEHLALNFSSSVRLAALGLGEGGVFLLCASLELSFPAADRAKHQCFVSSQNVWKGIPVSGHQETGGWPQSKSLMGQAAAVGEEGLNGAGTDRRTGPQALTPRCRESAQLSGPEGCHGRAQQQLFCHRPGSVGAEALKLHTALRQPPPYPTSSSGQPTTTPLQPGHPGFPHSQFCLSPQRADPQVSVQAPFVSINSL